MFVIDLAGFHEAPAQGKLPVQDLQRSRTELDSTVLTGLGGVLIDAADARFADCQGAVRRVEIRHQQGDMFGRTHSREKSELVVVPLSLAQSSRMAAVIVWAS